MVQNMGGKRYTKDEIDQVISLTAKGLLCREIAEKLGRPEQGIRSIRHRLGLAKGEIRNPGVLGRENSTDSIKVLREDLNSSIEACDYNGEIICDEINELKGRADRLEEKMKVASEQAKQPLTIQSGEAHQDQHYWNGIPVCANHFNDFKKRSARSPLPTWNAT